MGDSDRCGSVLHHRFTFFYRSALRHQFNHRLDLLFVIDSITIGNLLLVIEESRGKREKVE
jgi:hypothetical protein